VAVGAYSNSDDASQWSISYFAIKVTPKTPTVTLNTPANGATYTLGSTISISATGANCDHMNAFVNNTATGYTVGGNNYTGSFTPTAVATYKIYVMGRNTPSEGDAGTKTANSSTVTVTVISLPKTPTATLNTPANGATYTLGSTINISATGTNCDHMNAFVNGVATGYTVSGNDYTGTFTPTAAGTYEIYVMGRNTPTEGDVGTNTASTLPVTVTVKPVIGTPIISDLPASLTVNKGSSVKLSGIISCTTNIDVVSVCVSGWYGGLDGAGKLLTANPGSKSFSLSDFLIDSNSAAFPNTGIYTLKIWAKAVGEKVCSWEAYH
jgi:hypothetical protein